MNEQEIKVIERAIRDLDTAILNLTNRQREIGFHLEELEKVKATLTRLLPTEERIEKLFE